MEGTHKGGRPRGSEPKELSKGRWSIRVSFTEGDRRVYRKAIKPSRQAARDWLNQQLAEVREAPDLVANDARTFKDLRTYYTEHYACVPVYDDEGVKISGLRSWEDYRRRIKTLGEEFDPYRLNEIRPEHLRRYQKKRLTSRRNASATKKENLSWATVNRELAILRAMLSVGVDLGWAKTNVAKRVKGLVEPGKERTRQRVLTKREFETLYRSCRKLPVAGERLALVVLAAVQTGLRWNELVTLTWENVDIPNGTLLVTSYNSKTAKERVIGIPDRLLSELSSWKRKTKPTTKTSRVFGVQGRLNKSFERARKGAGLEDVRFHDLRHTFCSWLVEAGMNLPEVGNLAGHSRPQTTARYANATPKTTQRGRSAMNRIFATKKRRAPETSDATSAGVN